MEFASVAYVTGIGVLIANVLFVARLVAARMGHDPITNRYKPNSPERKAVKEFVASRRYVIALGVSSLTLPALAIFVA